MTGKERFNNLFNKKFPLIVSIVKNDPELARVAEESGADAIKLHINVEHFASGTRFGSWSEEKENIRQILDNITIPAGLLPGDPVCASKEEILEAAQMGISFIDSFAHRLPVDLFGLPGLGYMLAVNRDYSAKMVEALDFAGIDAVEATILTHDQYGNDLTMGDFSLYYQLAQSLKSPLMIPTQKKIRAGEVETLHKAGAAGIIIGAVVTGRTVEGLRETTSQFRRAIDKIKEKVSP